MEAGLLVWVLRLLSSPFLLLCVLPVSDALNLMSFYSHSFPLFSFLLKGFLS